MFSVQTDAGYIVFVVMKIDDILKKKNIFAYLTLKLYSVEFFCLFVIFHKYLLSAAPPEP